MSQNGSNQDEKFVLIARTVYEFREKFRNDDQFTDEVEKYYRTKYQPSPSMSQCSKSKYRFAIEPPRPIPKITIFVRFVKLSKYRFAIENPRPIPKIHIL